MMRMRCLATPFGTVLSAMVDAPYERTAMTRVTIIHNTTAGDGGTSGDSLRRLVAGRGYQVAYATTDDDLDEALNDPGDLVVAAGGDGTVGRVAARLVGRGIPLAVLALGTANNVSRRLGLPVEGSARELAFDWEAAGRRRLDVGVARGPWGTRHFVESFGIGVFAAAMPILSALKKGAEASTSPAAELAHDQRALAALLGDYRAHPMELRADGRDRSGEYLMVEAVTAGAFGARLPLVPAADPSDGVLWLVTVGPDRRDAVADWMAEGGGEPPVDAVGIGELRFVWQGEPLHVDGRPWGDRTAPFEKARTAEAGEGRDVMVSLEPEGVPVLVPRP
jgi:diacylglycerol kinase family enzyme